jgi:ribosome-binding protein aMBF1 (putative translation factor)
MLSFVHRSPMKERAMTPDQSISPLGADITEDHERDYERSAEYRAEWERQSVAFAIAKVVHERRTELGLSQDQLGDRIGTTGSVISRIESGRHTASISSLQRIAVALDAHLVVTLEPVAV